MSASTLPALHDADFPANGSPLEKLGFVLKYLALGSAESKWQPWDFRLEDSHIELIATGDVQSQSGNLDDREAIIGCGAALACLRIALKHFGCLGRVALFPDLGQPELAARIHFGFCRERTSEEGQLFEAMVRRYGEISPGMMIPVSDMTLTLLSETTRGERSWLDIMASETSRGRVMGMPSADLSEWASSDRSSSDTANVSLRGDQLVWPPHFVFTHQKTGLRNDTDASLDPAPVPAAALAVIKTKTDDKQGWLAAGQTMAQTVLQARALGLCCSCLNRVNQRQVREALRVGIGHKGYAQVILSFGPVAAGEWMQPTMPAGRSSPLPPN